MNRNLGLGEWLLVLFLLNGKLLAAPGSLDLNFDPGSRFTNGHVRALALQGDGKVLVAGDFNWDPWSGFSSDGLARLNPDGTTDTNFTVTMGWHTNFTVVVDSQGRILLGGFYGLVNGVIRNGLTRFLSNGSIDETFVPASNIVEVSAIAFVSEGKLLVGSRYFNSSNVLTGGILRLNADGSIDQSFRQVGVVGRVHALTPLPDGRIVFGGFSNPVIGGLQPDGQNDASFPTSIPGVGYVWEILPLPNEKLLIASSSGRVVRIYADGGIDSGFSCEILSGSWSPAVTGVAQQPNGKLIIAGAFQYVNGVFRPGVARLNEDGSLDHSFDPGAGTYGLIWAVKFQADGKVVIGGEFEAFNQIRRGQVARLYGDPYIDLRRPAVDELILSWPNTFTGLIVQVSSTLDSGSWQTLSSTVHTTSSNQFVIVKPPAIGRQFYRLSPEVQGAVPAGVE